MITSLMLMRGSSSTMVPIACPSPIVAFVGALRLTAKVSFGSGEAVALDRDRERPARLAGRDDHDPGPGRVVAAGRGGDVRRDVVDRHANVGGVREGQREG